VPNSTSKQNNSIKPLKTLNNLANQQTSVPLQQIVDLAIALFTEDKSPERDFTKTFAYAFELLVDADYQLQHIDVSKLANRPSPATRQRN
jgi:hypothetical protein